MSLILLMTALSGYGGTTQDTGTVLTRFLAPDVHAKPMARMRLARGSTYRVASSLVSRRKRACISIVVKSG